MKVLYVLKRFPRLSETFVLNEILGLEGDGIEVLVDSLRAREAGPAHPELSALRAAVRYLPRSVRVGDKAVLAAHLRLLRARPGPWREQARLARAADAGPAAWQSFLLAGLVADRARRERVDHLHAHFATSAAEVVTVAAALAGVPCTVTAHAKDIYHADNAGQVARRLGRADAVVTVSAYNAEHLRGRLAGLDRVPPVLHVPNGVPLGPVADPAAAQRVLAVARLVEKKGIDVLVEAAALLRPTHPGLAVDVIGDGPLRGALADQVQHLGLGDCVRFLGPATSDAVAAAMAASRVVALPCRIAADGDRDGLPTVLVEALARAVPVVSTDVVGIGELVQDGLTGRLVPPDDPARLAQALEVLLRDGALATRLGVAGRELVAAQYAPQVATRLLRQAFAAAAGVPAEGPSTNAVAA